MALPASLWGNTLTAKSRIFSLGYFLKGRAFAKRRAVARSSFSLWPQRDLICLMAEGKGRKEEKLKKEKPVGSSGGIITLFLML